MDNQRARVAGAEASSAAVPQGIVESEYALRRSISAHIVGPDRHIIGQQTGIKRHPSENMHAPADEELSSRPVSVRCAPQESLQQHATMRPTSRGESTKGSQRRQIQPVPIKTLDVFVLETRPGSPEIEVDEQSPAPNRARFSGVSIQSSSKDSGVVLDPEDMVGMTKPGPPSHQHSYFDTDDESDDGMNEEIYLGGNNESERPSRLAPDRVESRVAFSLDELQQSLPELDYESDDQATVTEDISEAQVDRILNYTLRTVLGVELANLPQGIQRDLCRTHTLRFAETLTDFVETTADLPTADATDAESSPSSTPAAMGDNSLRRGSNSPAGQSGKRKSDNLDSDIDLANGRNIGVVTASTSSKRLCQAVKIRCPFRARNPLRFNVRDHQVCAMTYFRRMPDLRKHVRQKHCRDETSKFQCDRCNEMFTTKLQQQAHSKRPEGCESQPLDPEDGVDGDTIMEIVNRNRETSKPGFETSIEAQWHELWYILFPGDAPDTVPSYTYLCVMEDYQLEAEFRGLVSLLAVSLQEWLGLSGNDNASRQIQGIVLQHFNIAVESCHDQAKNMAYSNRGTPTTNSTRPGQRKSFGLHSLAGQLSSRDSGIGTEISSIRPSELLSLTPNAHTSLPLRPTSQPFYTNNYAHELNRTSFVATPSQEPAMPLTTDNLVKNQGQFFVPPGASPQLGIAGPTSPGALQSQIPAHLSATAQSYAGNTPYREPLLPQGDFLSPPQMTRDGGGFSSHPEIQTTTQLQDHNLRSNHVAPPSLNYRGPNEQNIPEPTLVWRWPDGSFAAAADFPENNDLMI